MKNKLVSIIMPTYNRAPIIREAIISIIRQTYQDWELYVIIDGSKDSTYSIVNLFANSRIKIIKFRERHGAGWARNRGLFRAKGEYVAFLDDDNIWHPEFLQTMVDNLENDPSCKVVHCDFTLNDLPAGSSELFDGDYDFMKNCDHNRIDLNAIMTYTKLGLEVGGFNERLRCFIDWNFIMRLGVVAEFHHVRRNMVDYNRREDGIIYTYGKKCTGPGNEDYEEFVKEKNKLKSLRV